MNLIKSIINLLKYILNIGTVEGKSSQNVSIYIVNLILLLLIVSFIIGAPSGIYNYFSSPSSDWRDSYLLELFALHSSYITISLLGLYFNSIKKYDIASGLATVGLSFVLFAYSYYASLHHLDLQSTRVALFFLPLSVAAPLAFRYRWLGIAGFMIIMTLLGIIIWKFDTRDTFNMIMGIFIVAIGMIITTRFIVQYLDGAAQELKDKNKLLLKQNELQKELINQNKLRTELLSILSHDLKGPAASFNILSKKVAFYLKKGKYKELEELGDYFELAGDKIYQDIDRLLNWTIAQKENIIVRNFESTLYGLVDEIAESIQFELKVKSIDFNSIPKDLTIITDFHILEIILKNLMLNAVKHSPPSSEISISYQSTAKGIEVSIHNLGEPIDMSFIEKAKAGKYHKSKNGHGLGLGICFSLIHFLDGELSYDVSSGTTAIVFLPTKKSDVQATIA